MCTVTYIPQKRGNYILTSNRDESADRSPYSISTTTRRGQELAFPRDTHAGGTWIAISSDDRTLCLLNGAFEAHVRRPGYKRSRGIMALDFFDYPDAQRFFREYEFPGMEPFTMIVQERGMLFEMRWDERQAHVRELDPLCFYIWSSSTLYDRQVRNKRQQWFDQWRENRTDFSLNAILDFHRHAGEGDPWNDVVMNRNGLVQTVSITSIARGEDALEMRYESLLRNLVNYEKIMFGGKVVELG